jgi:hypothetical protein
MPVRAEVTARTTDSERALEAILARVPAWRGRALRYRPVPGGISNTNCAPSVVRACRSRQVPYL